MIKRIMIIKQHSASTNRNFNIRIKHNILETKTYIYISDTRLADKNLDHFVNGKHGSLLSCYNT